MKLALLLDEVESTQDVLKSQWIASQREGSRLETGSWVAARHQSQGRGRQGRSWVMSPGGLALSVLIRSPHPPRRNLPLSLAVALEVREVLLGSLSTESRRAVESSFQIHWPNDWVDQRGRKLGGMLMELLPESETVYCVGIGINLLEAPDSSLFDGSQARAATSWAELCGETPRELEFYARTIAQALESLGVVSDWSPWLTQYEQASALKPGDWVSWSDGSDRGQVIGLGGLGELRVTPDRRLYSEDVRSVRVVSLVSDEKAER